MTLDRNAEVRRLNQADRHIADAERRITKQRAVIAELRGGRQSTVAAERTLNALTEMLEAYHDHRKLIFDMLAKIDAGQV